MIELDFKWISPFGKLQDTERNILEMKLRYVLQNLLFDPRQPSINISIAQHEMELKLIYVNQIYSTTTT